MLFLIIMSYVTAMTAAGPTRNYDTNNNMNKTPMPSRRILQGRPVGDTKPYMVYLRPSPTADPKFKGSDWLCGGVIIHERYILTSAACIEDAKNFYVVSGTSKWCSISVTNDECINNGAKKAIWKCVPKSYVFDGDEFDNIRWMAGDIAVVKVEDDFNFERRIQGCEFIPKKIAYNNVSMEITKPRTYGSIAGWGSNSSYNDWMQEPVLRSRTVRAELMETEVQLIANRNCKKRWEPRYHYLIDEQMICTKDVSETAMSSLCAEQVIDCKELEANDDDYADYKQKEEDYGGNVRRFMVKPGQLKVDSAAHFHDTRRNTNDRPTGGFCENDHGGPLIVGQGKTAMVVGLMSACLTRDISRRCYGPFLYTSVFRYKNMITCAIDKDHATTGRVDGAFVFHARLKEMSAVKKGPLRAYACRGCGLFVRDTAPPERKGHKKEHGVSCKKLLRSSSSPIAETYFDWSYHPDGPAKTVTTTERDVLRFVGSSDDTDETTVNSDKTTTRPTKSIYTTKKLTPKTKSNKKKS